MLTASDETLARLFCLACVMSTCFVLGVGWSAYRALGWVDRMKEWAMSVPIADDELDPKGVE